MYDREILLEAFRKITATLHAIFQKPLPEPSLKGNRKIQVSFLEDIIVTLTEKLAGSLKTDFKIIPGNIALISQKTSHERLLSTLLH